MSLRIQNSKFTHYNPHKFRACILLSFDHNILVVSNPSAANREDLASPSTLGISSNHLQQIGVQLRFACHLGERPMGKVFYFLPDENTKNRAIEELINNLGRS